MGIQDNIYPDLLARAERAATVLTDAELIAAAGTPEEAKRWIQLANNLKHILISTISAAAQYQLQQKRCADNTKQQWVLKYTGNFANAFQSPWEQGALATSQSCSSQPSTTTTSRSHSQHGNLKSIATNEPDQVKIAVLMNETTGPLQQHLHLNAGQAPTYPMIREIITEYYRTTTAFARLQQQASSSVNTNHNGGPAPMGISATYKGKGGRGKGNKGYKGKRQCKG